MTEQHECHVRGKGQGRKPS